MPNLSSSRPELLAPAGDWECVRAAIENGADAVYFGLDTGFNARARAKNFDVADLPRLMTDLHRRGLKGYITLNTLVFTSELPEVENLVRQIASAGVDAVLVQDLGLVRLIRAVCSELPIHASTQMTLTSSQTIAAAAELGVNRVVLARECSLDEIRRIRRECDLPLEVFVHGALCVAYSGQCLTSESLGGRSANRGQCAQACRLPYDLICDGRDVDLGQQKYLLSPQDLAAYDLIPELIDAGVCSFKIEGRLKTPEYVANIVKHYRQAIDAARAAKPIQFSPQEVEEMELSFSRGFSPGWLNGCDHKMLVPATSSSKRGVLLGHVRGIRKNRVIVELANRTVKRGDGISFDNGQPTDNDQGGRVYDATLVGRTSGRPEARPTVVELSFAHGALDFARIRPGMKVWKNDDPELNSRLRKSFATTNPEQRTPVDLVIRAAVGEPLTLTATTETGLRFELKADQPCAEAQKHALTEQTLRDQLGRLGGTPFILRNITADIVGRPMLPFSLLGRLRHQLVEQLEQLSIAAPPRTIAADSALSRFRDTLTLNYEPGTLNSPTLTILARSLSQLREVFSSGIKDVYADFADIREYRDAVALAREHSASIILATPRIQKPDELGIFHALTKHNADGILVRNLASLRFFHERNIPVIADFSLNAANEITSEYLIEQGAAKITPSYDLNRDQLLDLVAAVPAQWLEVVIHQHMPMFHMEHCVFCAVLSPGTNKHNCGRPCDTHQVKLRDRLGMEHPLTADVGCRNTLFNATPQSAAEIVPELLTRGIQNFRIELLDDRGPKLVELIHLYQRLLTGDATGKQVWTQLKATNRVGITRGTLEERRHPLAIV
jgi:putative protease